MVNHGHAAEIAKSPRRCNHLIRTCLRELDQVKLFALLGARAMTRDERVHEGFEIRPPPLRESIGDIPIMSVDAVTGELRPDRSKTVVQPLLKA